MAEKKAEKQHSTTVLGLKVRSAEELQEQCSQNTNSLLKQQLRAGLKEIKKDAVMPNTTGSTNLREASTAPPQISVDLTGNDACSALQSLANAAERQVPNALQALTTSAPNSYQQQLLLNSLISNNVMMNASNEFLQQQLQQQLRDDDYSPPSLNIVLDEPEKSEPELSLVEDAPESNYEKSPTRKRDSNAASTGTLTPKQSRERKADGNKSVRVRASSASSSRVVQRRRVRRKAQSSFDDQAEHLTEMSVRGLDLFRYASINDGVYQCIECAKENVEKTFKNKYSFQRHAFLYHEGKHRKVFPCNLCGKEFSRPDKMKNHMKMIHDGALQQQHQLNLARDTNSFSPLNYLINAAAAGELFAQQQQQHMQEQQQLQQQPQANHTQRHNEPLPRSSSPEQLALEKALLENLKLKHISDNPRPCEISLVAAGSRTSSVDENSAEFVSCKQDANEDFSADNDVLVKTEISISPSPSPPASLAAATQSRALTQRLEEVK